MRDLAEGGALDWPSRPLDTRDRARGPASSSCDSKELLVPGMKVPSCSGGDEGPLLRGDLGNILLHRRRRPIADAKPREPSPQPRGLWSVPARRCAAYIEQLFDAVRDDGRCESWAGAKQYPSLTDRHRDGRAARWTRRASPHCSNLIQSASSQQPARRCSRRSKQAVVDVHDYGAGRCLEATARVTGATSSRL